MDGRSGYKGYHREVTSIGEAQWDWQIIVPCTICGDTRGEVPIRCRRDFFCSTSVELGEPCLWIFDCQWWRLGEADEVWTTI